MHKILISIVSYFLALNSALALPDVVFVTQVPNPSDFATANATFGNHQATLSSIPRGGDLYIRYSDGTLKNITSAAGYGTSGFQGASSIAVRDPAVHWNGDKIVFSMVVGAPSQQYQVATYYWQLYEVTGIGKNQTPVITKVQNQPANRNNIMPVYGTDERIIFVTDNPMANAPDTYPQRDEYESTPTNTGLWSLNPTTGDLFQLDHAPSGDFNPIIDSFGRVLFIRWDHLQRDQQNRCSNASFGAFNYASESAGAAVIDSDAEVFPEPRGDCEKPAGSNLDNHTFNHFFPWQIREDGKEMETINHVGRHELTGYIGKTFNDDPNVEEFYSQYTRVNQNSVTNLFHIAEDPLNAGAYYLISAPEFGTHTSGQIVKMVAPPTKTADQITIEYITHPDTDDVDDTPSADHIGLTRDPAPLSDGTLIAAHAGSTRADSNIGTGTAPQSRYSYRLRVYSQSGAYYAPGQNLTSGITKSVNFWNPDQMVTFNNVTLWELQPREIRVRTKPNVAAVSLPAPEKKVFDDLGINVEEFRDYLRDNQLAVIVTRNATKRDNLDHQQPLNLKVAGSTTETKKNNGKLYEIAHLQLFQGDLIRGYNGSNSSSVGRRVLAQTMHSTSANPENPTGPSGSVKVAEDGSIAAFVPARRAMTYQLTDTEGKGVVRERFWLTFQPGEIRVCASCHGVNAKDQVGASDPTNEPQALRALLEHWNSTPHETPSPTMTLRISNVGGSKKENKVRPKVKLEVTGTNNAASNKTVKISLKVGKNDCGVIKELTTDSSGKASLTSKKLPALAKRSKLEFLLTYGSKEMDKRNITLQAQQSGLAAKRACAGLKKALK